MVKGTSKIGGKRVSDICLDEANPLEPTCTCSRRCMPHSYGTAQTCRAPKASAGIGWVEVCFHLDEQGRVMHHQE